MYIWYIICSLRYIHFLRYSKGRQIFHKCSRLGTIIPTTIFSSTPIPLFADFFHPKTTVRLVALLLETKWGCGRVSNRNIIGQMLKVNWVKMMNFEFASPVPTDARWWQTQIIMFFFFNINVHPENPWGRWFSPILTVAVGGFNHQGWRGLASELQLAPVVAGKNLRVGSKVRVRKGVRPSYGWGNAAPGQFGVVVQLQRNVVIVRFPEAPHWQLGNFMVRVREQAVKCRISWGIWYHSTPWDWVRVSFQRFWAISLVVRIVSWSVLSSKIDGGQWRSSTSIVLLKRLESQT